MTGVPTPPWSRDPVLDAVLDGIAGASGEFEKNRASWIFRAGTVESVDFVSAQAWVRVDNDPVATPLQVLGEDVTPGGRCVVLFVPPHGGYVIGPLGIQRWALYTPEVRFDTGVISVGNGIADGAYRRRGNHVEYRIKFLWGSTTTGGSGAIRFGLPIPAADTYNIGVAAGAAMMIDAGTARGWFPAIIDPGDPQKVYLLRGGIGTMGMVFVDSATPIPWAPNDGVHIRGSYEVA